MQGRKNRFNEALHAFQQENPAFFQ